MGGKRSTSSSSSSGSSSSNNNNNQSTVNQGKKYVSDTLGLGLGGKANNLTGKDQDFYGREASKAADDFLISEGKAKAGTYFRQVGGDFIRISQEEGERLYKAGEKSDLIPTIPFAFLLFNFLSAASFFSCSSNSSCLLLSISSLIAFSAGVSLYFGFLKAPISNVYFTISIFFQRTI